MAPVADYIHNLGLKFGMYSSAGIYTCGKYPGSLGYETQDAEYWASVGSVNTLTVSVYGLIRFVRVDYLKYDNVRLNRCPRLLGLSLIVCSATTWAKVALQSYLLTDTTVRTTLRHVREE